MERIEINRYIVANPNVCHGQPVFKGTRIMVYLILEMLAAGESAEEILADYPSLNREYIKAALEFAASITERARVGILTK